MEKNKDKKLIEEAISASIEAGDRVMEIYGQDFEVEFKEDESPLTAADTASNNVINRYLNKTGIPVLSEEGKSIPYQSRRDWQAFWIVDPLDGTKEFIKRNGEFTINIALVENGTPILGVIYIPVQKILFFASKTIGSYRIKIKTGKDFPSNLEDLIKMADRLPIHRFRDTYRIVGSKSHLTTETEQYIEQLKKDHENVEIISRGSSLKICMVAEGEADIYPRLAPTMEWDIAAGHAIAKYAGRQVVHYTSKKELTYNSESLVNPWFIVL